MMGGCSYVFKRYHISKKIASRPLEAGIVLQRIRHFLIDPTVVRESAIREIWPTIAHLDGLGCATQHGAYAPDKTVSAARILTTWNSS